MSKQNLIKRVDNCIKKIEKLPNINILSPIAKETSISWLKYIIEIIDEEISE